MRKILFLVLLIAGPAFAGGKYAFKDPKIDDEFENNYHEHKFPNWINAKGSSATVTYISVSTLTVNGVNAPALPSTQTWSGANTYTGALIASTGTIKSFMVVGTATNDDAPTLRVGEYTSTATLNTNVAATTAYGDCGTLSLTPGDWEISVNGNWLVNDSTLQTLEIGVSVTAGNSGTGLNVEVGNRQFIVETGLVSGDRRLAIIPAYRVSLSATTTHYLKYRAVYPAGKPQLTAIMTARRMR